jgi:hypothetical protein
VIFAASGLNFEAAGTVVVHWLPQTARMRQGSEDRQSDGSYAADEQQNKQQSGGQAMHG